MNLYKLLLVIGIPLALVACEGANITNSGADGLYTDGVVTTEQLPEIPGIDPPTGDVPAHCAKLNYKYVKKLIGCSQDSYRRCVCWDPTNPNQPLTR